MPFNILVGAGFFVHECVDRCILNLIQDQDIVLVGNGNTLSTKAFRLQDDIIQKLEASGAHKVIYTELTSRNMAVLKKTDIIYIMGGDAREIVELYQNELFKTLLKKHLKKGILLVEQEAAVLLSNRIDWCLKECFKIKDNVYKSLDIIAENILICDDAFDQKNVKKIEKIEKNYQIQLTKLSKDECYFISSISP